MTDRIASIHVGRSCLPLPCPEARFGQQSMAGEYLSMMDGSVWFHPYSGAAPFKLQDEKAV